MAINIHNKAVERTLRRIRLNRWNKIVTCMAAVVVFCTTYALILPAITMEHEATCGMEEHVHTDACLGLPKELTCSFQKEAGKESETYVIHTHNEFCYDTEGNLICKLPEIGEHVHDDSCYTLVTPEPPHVHVESCWEDNLLLSCTKKESDGHTHTEECYKEVDELVCKLPESEGHAHGDGCYDEEGNLTCTKEVSVGHTHSSSCYVKKTVCACGLEESEEHHHTKSCYILNDRKLTCKLEEATPDELANPPQPYMDVTCGKLQLVLHTHTDGCYDAEHNLICEKPEAVEHVHTEACLTETTDPNAQKVLVCGKEEHTHEKPKCYIDLEADLENELVWEDTLPELVGENWADDLLAVAVSQLDYQESEVNVTITPDGDILGYTRYGQWAKEPYGQWSSHFVNFCLHYAGIEAEAFPKHEGELPWCEKLREDNFGIYFTPDTYTPVPGDLVYFDQNVDGTFDRMGIVEQLLPAKAETEEEAKLMVIEGDAENAVRRVNYKPDAPEILGYASTRAARERWDILNPAEPERYCGLEEHTHTDDCKDENGEIICGHKEHTHTEECLIAPPTYICGKEEHRHSENCYDNKGELTCTLEEHNHSDDCIEKVYYCGLAEHTHTESCYDAEQNLICTVYEHVHTDDCLVEHTYYCGQTLHIHDASCRDAEGNLTCTKEEHVHNEKCLVEKTYYCGLEVHAHDASCRDAEGSLICTKEEHFHTEQCEKQTVYCCGLAEHTHDESCKDENGDLICTLAEHTHTDACVAKTGYRCNLEEHTHVDACKDAEGNLTCGQEEHTHDETCIVYYICGQEEHKHTEACKDAEGNLICGLEEHTHGTSCQLVGQTVNADIQSDAANLSLDETSGPRVTVTGYMPEGVTVTAIPLDVEGALFAYDVTIYYADGNEFQPLIPVQVSFFVPGITDDPENEVEIYHGANAESEEVAVDPADPSEPAEPVDTQGMTRMDSRPDGKGGIVVDAPHFSPFVGVRAALPRTVTEDCCEGLADQWWRWTQTSNDNPFGSAQHFNVFLMEDLVGFNAIHGNAAIGGSIYGPKNTTIGYPEGSNFNYQADATAMNEICLVLGGEIMMSGEKGIPDKTPGTSWGGLPAPLQVSNGTAVLKEDIVTRPDFDNQIQTTAVEVELDNSKRPSSHYHQVPKDSYYKFDTVFADAGRGSNATCNPDAATPGEIVEKEGTLQYHNHHIYQYALGLKHDAEADPTKRDPHLGYNYRYGDLNEAQSAVFKDVAVHGGKPDDILLHGDNAFYNVFNLRADKIKPLNGQARIVWLDIPVGSYVMINVLGMDENGNQVTEIPDFGMQFWYRDTEGEWTKQPAKILSQQGEGYNQSQMLLVNIDPHVKSLDFDDSTYFQASILAPHTDMTCNSVDLYGTIVFNSMKGEGNNNVIYSPFYTGTSMNLAKAMYCDTPAPGTDHSDINEGGSGNICQIKEHGPSGETGWPNYFADVKFKVSDTLGGAGRDAVLKNIPIDNEFHNFGGLAAGYYTVADEIVYIKAHNGGGGDSGFEYKERRLTVDEDGYWMVAMYLGPDFMDETSDMIEDPNVNNWTLVYCDAPVTIENGEYVCSIPATLGDWNLATDLVFSDKLTKYKLTPEQKASLVDAGKLYKADETQINIFRHQWNYGLFSQNGGAEKPTLTVQSNNPLGNVVLGNHYSISPVKSATVYKEWGEDRDFETKLENGTIETETIFVPVAPPPEATIQVTLYRKIAGGTETKVPAQAPTEANPKGLPNPVTLHGPDSWTYMWTGLPREDESGNEYLYSVKESSGWPGWEGTFKDNGDGSFTIENREKPVTGLTVEKEWFDYDGVQLTEAEINAADPALQSKVQLYQVIGHAPQIEDYVHADNPSLDDPRIRYIDVFLNEVKTDNLLGTIPYFPGSDVNVMLNLWVMGPEDANYNLAMGHADQMKLALDGKNLTTTVGKGSAATQFVNTTNFPNTRFSNILVSADIKNLDGNHTLILKTSAESDTYPVVRKADVDKIETEAVKKLVHAPKPDVDYDRYNTEFIGWEDTMKPYPVYGLIDLGTQSPAKWTYSWNDLPLYNESDPSIRYGYYVVEEEATEGYTPTYFYTQTLESQTHVFYDGHPRDEKNGNIRERDQDTSPVNAGIVSIRNQQDKPKGGPPLPDCGGSGTLPYTLGGLLSVICAALLIQYNQKKRRKEGNAF